MARIMEVIRGIRNVRSEFDVDPARQIPAVVVSSRHTRLFREQAAILILLARLDPTQLTITRSMKEKPQQAVSLVTAAAEVYLPLAGMVDLEVERQRVEREIAQAQQDLMRIEALLANEGFIAKAPADVVAKERERLVSARERLRKLEERRRALHMS